MLDIQIAVSKINKYATRESGDTVEVVERPQGGFTALLVDGQGSGRASKLISQLVTSKALDLIKDGVRDGVVARAAHDYLFLQRGGKVSATLTVCSVDFSSRSLVLARNSHCPLALYCSQPAGLEWLDGESQAIGLYRHTRPVMYERPLAAGTWVVAFSDGILEAGRRAGIEWDVRAAVAAHLPPGAPPTVRGIADSLLAGALAADQGRPQDDMSVLVLAVLAAPDDTAQIRTFDMRVPTDS
jgi:serine phosphatase RsbU (regulator of sigma subunit)